MPAPPSPQDAPTEQPKDLLVARFTSDGEPLADGADGARLSAHVELPPKADVAAYDVDEVVFSGWVLAPASLHPVIRMRDHGDPDHRVLATAPVTHRRPEVAAAFDPSGARGLEGHAFSIGIGVGELTDSTEVVLEVTDGEMLARSAPYRLARTPLARVNNVYVTEAPSARHAIDLFAGDWSSRLPGDLAPGSGRIPTFHDPRVSDAVDALGGIEGMRVLELGPLEAGHTSMLEELGAASILAIESHSLAYLKCLVVKELLGLERARFELGDFMPYLRDTDDHFDLTVAFGVLYHQREPLDLLTRLARVSDRLMLWTAYFDERAPMAQHGRRFTDPVEARLGDRVCRLHPMDYGSGWDSTAFCGGPEPGTRWMERDDILGCLGDLGFARVEVVAAHDDREGPLGSTFLVVATR
jgi:hypothetical protein